MDNNKNLSCYEFRGHDVEGEEDGLMEIRGLWPDQGESKARDLPVVLLCFHLRDTL